MPDGTARAVLAAALCDAANGEHVWICLANPAPWLHRADEVIHELALRGWMVRAIEEEVSNG